MIHSNMLPILSLWLVLGSTVCGDEFTDLGRGEMAVDIDSRHEASVA